jgi:hypothetical protein
MRPQRPNLPAIEYRLNGILKNRLFPLLSFGSICTRLLRRNRTYVRKQFPEQARQLHNRYLTNQRLWVEKDRAMYVKSLKEIAKHLHQIGVVPNAQNLSKFETLKGRIRATFAQKAVMEVRTELGYYSNARQLELAI